MRRITVGDFRIGDVERAAVMEVLDSGRISEGPRVRQFELAWAEFVGTRYCVATSSGFGALVVTWQALKYQRGIARGKVITSPLTYIADATSLALVGLEPVFVDVDPDTFGITPEAVRKHLAEAPDTEAYVGLMPVDLMGYPVRIDEFREIAAEYSLALVDDAAQAHGTLYQGHRAGSQGDAGIFSFYIAHNVQAGEMGAVVTDDLELYKLVKRLKAQGRACECIVCTRAQGICPGVGRHETGVEDADPRFTHDLIGFNFKTMEFQAALAIGQVAHVDDIIRKRYDNVAYLANALAPYSHLLQLPAVDPSVSYLAFPLVVREGSGLSRGALRDELEKRGVETRPLFGSIPTQQPAFAHLKAEYAGRLPNADRLGAHGLYVGCHQYLEEDDLRYLAQAFIESIAAAVG